MCQLDCPWHADPEQRRSENKMFKRIVHNADDFDHTDPINRHVDQKLHCEFLGFENLPRLWLHSIFAHFPFTHIDTTGSSRIYATVPHRLAPVHFSSHAQTS